MQAAGIPTSLTCSSTISVCALAAAMTATVLLFQGAPSNFSGALGPPQAACKAHRAHSCPSIVALQLLNCTDVEFMDHVGDALLYVLCGLRLVKQFVNDIVRRTWPPRGALSLTYSWRAAGLLQFQSNLDKCSSSLKDIYPSYLI